MSFPIARWSVFALLGGLVLLFPADGLRALGLGEARVDSYLGQPLDVTIVLLEAEADEIEGVTVGPAAPEDFQRLGVPAEALGLGLEVTVDRSAQPPSVRVRSRQPVEDPIVQILIDARWGSGRMLREYTLFLDPPTVDSPPPARPAPAVTETEETPAPVERDAEPARPSARPTPDERATDPATEPTRTAGDVVTVNRGDTLWGIAYDWRPHTGMSMDQVMMAIFERNRGAFGENINHLRSGAELIMPDADEVGSIDQASAAQRVREQMQAWQQQALARDVPEVTDAGVAETDVTEPAPAAEEEPEAVHRLDVVPPEEDEFADGPVVSEGEIRRVQRAVADIEDEIMAERLESEAFDEHIAEIREALDTRDAAGLAVAEESLAELEARLREARQEQQAEAEAEEDEVATYFEDLERELVDADETGVDADPVADPELAQIDGIDDDADPAEEPAVATTEDSEVAPLPTTPTGGPGMPAWLWAAVGLGGILLLGIGFLALYRRRSSRTQAVGDSAGRRVQADSEQAAREAVAAKPGDLAAHLALLRILSDRNDSRSFSGALDEMYRQVRDEEDEHWQEALNLAVVTAPNHPLLTPAESPAEKSDDLEQRADQLMDMLDSDTDEQPDESAQADQEQAEAMPDLDMPEEDEPAGEPSHAASGTDSDEELGEDLDLAELSNRLDEPKPWSQAQEAEASDEEDFDLGELELDDDSPAEPEPTREEAAADERGEREPASGAEPEGEMELDFEFSSSADKDELEASLAELESDEQAEGDAAAASDADDPDEAETDLEFDLDAPTSDDEADLAYELDAEDSDAGQSPADEVSDAEMAAPDDDGDDLAVFAEANEEPPSGEDIEATALPDETFDDSPATDDAAGQESPESAGESLETAEEPPESVEDSGPSSALGDEDADVKLDLARAYMAVDLADSAREILEEVVSGGSAEKQEEARKLLDDL